MSNENPTPDAPADDLLEESAAPAIKRANPIKTILSKRFTKIALGITFVFIVIAMMGGNKEDTKPSSLGVKPPDRPVTDPNMVDPRIAEELKKRDAKNAELLASNPNAVKAGDAYLPRVTNETEDPLGAYAKASSGQGAPVSIPVPPPLPPPAPPSPTAVAAAPLPSGSQGPKGDPRYVVLAKTMRKALDDKRLVLDPSLSPVEIKSAALETATGGSAQATGAAAAPIKPPPLKLANLGDLFYGTMDLEANSDYSSFVQATVIGGPLNGAKLQGSFKRTTDRLEIVFNKASLNGQTLQVNAIATHPEDPKVGLATDVNYHYLARFGGLFTAAFIRGYGEELEREGTKVSVNADTGTVVEETPDRSSGDLAILGTAEVADEASQYLRGQINRPPTVIVAANTPIGVLLRADVFDTALVAPPEKAPEQIPSQITPQPYPVANDALSGVGTVIPTPVTTGFTTATPDRSTRLQDYARSVTANNRNREMPDYGFSDSSSATSP